MVSRSPVWQPAKYLRTTSMLFASVAFTFASTSAPCRKSAAAPGRKVKASSFVLRQQAGIAADRRRVDSYNLLGGKTVQIVWPSGLRSGPRHFGAAERLGADHRANHVAVGIDVAMRQSPRDPRDGLVDARMNPQRQRGPVRGDVVE